MDRRGVTAENVLDAVQTYGASSGGMACIQQEELAAQESIETGLYVTYMPREVDSIAEAAVRQRYAEGINQCGRVGSNSKCLCGHSLDRHKPVNRKSNSFIRPPKCDVAKCQCFGFNYMPSRPEECGQWWLPRRRDFSLSAWRQRVQRNPAEYACIGCDLKLTDHETIFETELQRRRRGASVGSAYLPLQDTPSLRQEVVRVEGCSARPRVEQPIEKDGDNKG